MNLEYSVLMFMDIRDLLPFVQFKKLEKHPMRSDLLFLSKSNTLPWVFFTFFKLCKWYQIAQSASY